RMAMAVRRIAVAKRRSPAEKKNGHTSICRTGETLGSGISDLSQGVQMIRKPVATAPLFAFALAIPTFGNSILRVYTDERHNIHLLTAGKDTVIAANQVGIDAVKISENK